MPIEHRADKKTGFMHVRRWGSIITHDEDEALKERRDDPLVVPDIPVIVDCREVDPPDSSDVVRYIADRVSAIAAELECGPVAIAVQEVASQNRTGR